MSKLSSYIFKHAVRECRVSPPLHPLGGWQLAGPLAFKEQNGLAEGICIIMTRPQHERIILHGHTVQANQSTPQDQAPH